jgi:hypothetical protein
VQHYWSLILRALRTMRGVCGVALLVGSASFSYAQEAVDPPQVAAPIPVPQEELVVVRKKRVITDPYAPIGIGIGTGGIRLFPSFEIDAIIASNPQKSATNPQAGLGLILKPSLSFASDWSRHSWTGSATGAWQRFSTDDYSTLTGSLQSDFRLDIRHTTRADFSASYNLSQSGIENSQVPGNALNPRRDQSFGARAAITHDFGGLEGTATTSLTRNIFDDVPLVGGGIENNADRNYLEPSLGLRGLLGGAGAPLKPFAEIIYAPRFHDQALDRNNQQRDSQGLTLSAGVAFDEGPIWAGELALTDLLRSYADPALGTANTFGITGRVTWRPTEITTIDATSSVSLGETTTAGIAASKNWTGGLNLTHALRDNLSVLAGTSLSIQDTGTSIDRTSIATLGLNWEVNPNMTTGVTYTGTWFADGNGSGDYNDQRVMTRIILKQ